MFKPRPLQQDVLNYPGGRMGVSAVPGSGKTHTLAYLASNLISGDTLREGQEILIVTLVNSAVNNFAQKIRGFLDTRGMLASSAYRVRTLHGLAHDIVRERPALAGLADDFQIIDERASLEIMKKTVLAWTKAHPSLGEHLFDTNLSESKLVEVRRDDWPELVEKMSLAFIRRAKDLQITPGQLRTKYKASGAELPLLEMCLDIYQDYQHSLTYRAAVDFDDLVRLALQTIQLDQAYLLRLRARWPFILEDEAQDSNLLQQQILNLLAGESGNWIRVGDPNQAINETFTTADPKYFRDFIRQAPYHPSLLNSGRSTQSIMTLANNLVDWLNEQPPVDLFLDTFDLTHIIATPPGDPQPNPPDDPSSITLLAKDFASKEEIAHVAKQARLYTQAHPDQTIAVLVTSNRRGAEFVKALQVEGARVVEILKNTGETRRAAKALKQILNFLASPENKRHLVDAFDAWWGSLPEDQKDSFLEKSCLKIINQAPNVEDFTWPLNTGDWLDQVTSGLTDLRIKDLLIVFREQLQTWQLATLLPIDQLILTISQEIHHSPAELALDYKLALILNNAQDLHPEWRLPQLATELGRIENNEYSLRGFSIDDQGFDPKAHQGKVVVATIHKAKGLEWDCVFLTSANNYDFPSLGAADEYLAEKYWLVGRRNLVAEVLNQLEGIVENDPGKWALSPDDVKEAARVSFAAERMRLFYVGITRAKRALNITWNTGIKGQLHESAAASTLRTKWEMSHHENA